MPFYRVADELASGWRVYIVAAAKGTEIAAIFAFVEHIRANCCNGCAVVTLIVCMIVLFSWLILCPGSHLRHTSETCRGGVNAVC